MDSRSAAFKPAKRGDDFFIQEHSEVDTKLLTSEQVADILGVTGHTLAVWRSTGRYDLPYVKSGRLVRYREADVSRFIERRTRSTFGVDSSAPRAAT